MDLKLDIAERVDRLGEIIAEVLEAEESGKRVERTALFAANLDLTAELEQFFAQHDKLRLVSAPLRPVGGSRNSIAKHETDPALRPTNETVGGRPSNAPKVQRFGDYDLLELIAVGGMGLIYRAHQRSLNRRVALKMIRSGVFATKSERERFRFEAEAVAALDHPNIVPVFEVGEEAGMPYFSMKLMEGGDLGELARKARPHPVEAARAIAAIARAVHHAHQRGVLHRDLKPSNILLDGEGRPHVTDFGLAKLVQAEGKAARTLSGLAVGTPSYMAPEQARGGPGSASTAADVYSLGAVLYELLTGVPPLRGDTPVETLRKVLDEEPPSPRKHNPLIDDDLETISLKCLEKAPERRYASALALAEELERYAKGEPILARPISTVTRVVKWSKRRPAVAALAALLVFVLVGSFATVTWLWLHADEQRLLAEKRGIDLIHERDEVQRQRDLARENFDLAFSAVENLSNELAGPRLLDDPATAPVRSGALRLALQYYERFLDKRASDPTVASAVAQAYLRHGRITEGLLSAPDAEPSFKKARELLEPIVLAQPDNRGLELQLCEAMSGLGRCAHISGRGAEAVTLMEDAIGRQKKLLEHTPDDTELQRLLAATYVNLGSIRAQLQNPAAALVAFRDAEKLLESLVERHPDDVEYTRFLAMAKQGRGGILSKRRELGEALEALEEARTHIQRLVDSPAPSPTATLDLANLLHTLGATYYRSNRREDALATFLEARGLTEAFHRVQPSAIDGHFILSACHGNLALWYRDNARANEAIPHDEQRLAVLTKLVEIAPKNARARLELVCAWYDAGLTLESLDRKDEAITPFEKCLAEGERLLRIDRSTPVRQRLANAHHHLGLLHRVRKDFVKAAASFDASVQLNRQLVLEEEKEPSPHSDLAQSLGALAGLANQEREWGRAAGLYAEAANHDVSALKLMPQNRRYRDLLSGRLGNLALAQRRCGQVADAAATSRRRLEYWPQDAEQHFTCARELAACAVGDDEAAIEAFAVESIQRLEQAIKLGFRNRESIDKAAEFKSLKNRDDFQEVFRKLTP
jgi:tetratricopeptide (TPR) repeat protein